MHFVPHKHFQLLRLAEYWSMRGKSQREQATTNNTAGGFLRWTKLHAMLNLRVKRAGYWQRRMCEAIFCDPSGRSLENPECYGYMFVAVVGSGVESATSDPHLYSDGSPRICEVFL